MRPPRHPAPAREPFVRDPVRLRAGGGSLIGVEEAGITFSGALGSCRFPEARSRDSLPLAGRVSARRDDRWVVQLSTEGPPPVPAAPGHPPRKGEGRCRLRHPARLRHPLPDPPRADAGEGEAGVAAGSGEDGEPEAWMWQALAPPTAGHPPLCGEGWGGGLGIHVPAMRWDSRGARERPLSPAAARARWGWPQDRGRGRSGRYPAYPTRRGARRRCRLRRAREEAVEVVDAQVDHPLPVGREIIGAGGEGREHRRARLRSKCGPMPK